MIGGRCGPRISGATCNFNAASLISGRPHSAPCQTVSENLTTARPLTPQAHKHCICAADQQVGEFDFVAGDPTTAAADAQLAVEAFTADLLADTPASRTRARTAPWPLNGRVDAYDRVRCNDQFAVMISLPPLGLLLSSSSVSAAMASFSETICAIGSRSVPCAQASASSLRSLALC